MCRGGLQKEGVKGRGGLQKEAGLGDHYQQPE